VPSSVVSAGVFCASPTPSMMSWSMGCMALSRSPTSSAAKPVVVSSSTVQPAFLRSASSEATSLRLRLPRRRFLAIRMARATAPLGSSVPCTQGACVAPSTASALARCSPSVMRARPSPRGSTTIGSKKPNLRIVPTNRLNCSSDMWLGLFSRGSRSFRAYRCSCMSVSIIAPCGDAGSSDRSRASLLPLLSYCTRCAGERSSCGQQRLDARRS